MHRSQASILTIKHGIRFWVGYQWNLESGQKDSCLGIVSVKYDIRQDCVIIFGTYFYKVSR